MIHTMVTTMDRSGRLVVPSHIRREAALEPGAPLDIRWRDGVIEIEPQPLSVTFVRERRLLVARPAAKTPALTTAIVERTREQLAARRGGRLR